MKLYVTSDIHLEFGDLVIENRDDVDVLILSGDILVARDLDRPDYRGDRVHGFLKRVTDSFPNIVMVMGNHEHYHGDFSESADMIRAAVKEYSHFHLLDKECVTIGDYLFIGGTLWTDFNRGDPITLHAASSMMNDFRGVGHKAKGKRGGIWKFIPQDALDDHQQMKQYIETVISNRREQGDRSDRVIVVGHHAPSWASVHEKYRHDTVMNGCYYSNLEEFILDRPEIALWTHGHTHEDFDYMIGSTRVICNPRGYIGYESRADSWQPKMIEL
jgi:Icc-related predicted phosphoesterase